MLSDAAAIFFEPTDALPDLVEAFVGARFGEPFGELGERVLEAFGEALDDAAFLGGALLGEAVQAHLLGVVGEHLVQMHAVIRRTLDAQCCFGVEVPGAFAADHQWSLSETMDGSGPSRFCCTAAGTSPLSAIQLVDPNRP